MEMEYELHENVHVSCLLLSVPQDIDHVDLRLETLIYGASWRNPIVWGCRPMTGSTDRTGFVNLVSSRSLGNA